ncbi:MAG: hypothetical protein KDD62_11155 [Bdellovibrionales bacterium]|nr:hypothetical protein [Bdellovibrionales bacterium]
MINNFQGLLACPLTHSPLIPADEELLSSLNKLLDQGKLKNVSGSLLEVPLENLLLPLQDSSYGYPVYGGIASLMADQRIEVPQVADF